MEFEVRTKVTRTRLFEKQLAKLPRYLQLKVSSWILEVEFNGLAEAMKRPGYHDEPLQGERWGLRSVRMNRAYRVIYRVIFDRVHIELLEVNKHEY